MANEHTRPIPSSFPAQAERPRLTKRAEVLHHGDGSGVPEGIAPHRPTYLLSPPFGSSGTGSGSSSSKLPFFSSGDVTSPSSLYKTQTPPTELETPPKLVDSPPAILSPHPIAPDASLMPSASLHSIDSAGASQSLAKPTDSMSGTSESEGHVGPTRASIRAWAKATPAGPPGDVSSRTTPDLPQSSSDDDVSRVSLTRSARESPEIPERFIGRPGAGSSEQSPRGSLDRGESSGNVADGESSGSEQHSRSPPSGTPPPNDPALDAQRELTAPHPHPGSPTHPAPLTHAQHASHHRHPSHAHQHPTTHVQPHQSPRIHTHPHLHSHPRPPTDSQSSSESVPPASHAQPTSHPDQHERADRRHHHHHHRHHHPSGRRRHRDRDRDRERERDRSDRRSRHSNPAPDPTTTNPGGAAPSPSYVSFVLPPTPPTLTPLRPLHPPPPPLAPLRPLRVMDGTDVFDEIVKMLRTARPPLLRTGGGQDDDGWYPLGPPRENDVLDDIRRMIHWSRV